MCLLLHFCNNYLFKIMERLTLNEKIEMVRLVGDNVRSARDAAREFNNRHPDRHPVSSGTVNKVNQIFNQTGAVSKNILKSQNLHRPLRNNDVILNYFINNPQTSLRNASLILNIPKENIRRCLVKNKIKPFKPKFLHTLEPGDEERRMEFCLWLQGEYLNNRNYLSQILFSDEATFTTNGIISSQNSRHWASINPNWVINCKRQYSQKTNVWCGILHDRIIGPFFFDRNLNGNLFLDFLQNDFWEAVHNLPIHMRVNLKVQLDGSPVHNAARVREWLNQNYPNHWIGPNSPLVLWPPRSPDLTPLDFFLWGILKEKVYQSRPQSVQDLRQNIIQACAEIRPGQIKRTVKHMKKRCEKCIELNGALVEATKI